VWGGAEQEQVDRSGLLVSTTSGGTVLGERLVSRTLESSGFVRAVAVGG